MAPVIRIMPLAQNADVEMQLWLVSACCRHTALMTRSSSQDVVLQHISALRTNMSHPPRALRHLIMAEGFELLSNDPDNQPVLFPPKTNQSSVQEDPNGPLEPGQGSGSVPKSAQTGETGPSS